jgi:hypothetical protein
MRIAPLPQRLLAVVGAVALLCLGAGSGLLALALCTGSAGADTSTLGGYTISALAEPLTAQYEQPNFPVPATPSLEFDVGYANSTDGVGGGTATASTLYPGEILANAGPELSLLFPGVPLPPAPVWPLEAVSDFPQMPNSASLDEPGANMDAVSSTNGSTATATLGDDAATAGAGGTQPTPTPSGSGNPLAATSSLLGVGGASGTSSSSISDTAATAAASSTVTGVSLLGGFVNIGSVTSTATAVSDGTTGTLTGTTTVANASIAGEAVTITGNGISAAGKNEALALPISALNTLLGELGITLKVTNAVDSVQGAIATRTLNGLQVAVNLTTLDNAANKFASLLPTKLTSQLPIAIPNEQILTVYLATVGVSSAASPSFTSDDVAPSTATGTSPSGFDSGSGGTGDIGSVDTGSSDFGGTPGSSIGSLGSTTPSSTGPTPVTTGSPSSGLPLSTTPAVFKGVGSGLILLALLASAAMAYAYKRADDASELVGASCANGDPLDTRFDDDGEPGGFA